MRASRLPPWAVGRHPDRQAGRARRTGWGASARDRPRRSAGCRTGGWREHSGGCRSGNARWDGWDRSSICWFPLGWLRDDHEHSRRDGRLHDAPAGNQAFSPHDRAAPAAGEPAAVDLAGWRTVRGPCRRGGAAAVGRRGWPLEIAVDCEWPARQDKARSCVPHDTHPSHAGEACVAAPAGQVAPLTARRPGLHFHPGTDQDTFDDG